jgi:hypothetical protein
MRRTFGANETQLPGLNCGLACNEARLRFWLLASLYDMPWALLIDKVPPLSLILFAPPVIAGKKGANCAGMDASVTLVAL